MQDIRASITAEINFLNKTLLKEGPGVVVFLKKRNIKTHKTLLTAKKSNKSIHTLSKTYFPLKISTAKHC